QVPALLLHVDIGSAMLMLVIVVMTMIVPMAAAVPIGAVGMAIGVFMGKQTVFAVLLAVGQAEVTALTNPAQAQPGGIGLVECAFLFGWRAGNVIRIGFQFAAFQPHGKLAGTSGDAEGTGALIRHRVAAQFQV